MFSYGKTGVLGVLGSLVLSGHVVDSIDLDLTNTGVYHSLFRSANKLTPSVYLDSIKAAASTVAYDMVRTKLYPSKFIIFDKTVIDSKLHWYDHLF